MSFAHFVTLFICLIVLGCSTGKPPADPVGLANATTGSSFLNTAGNGFGQILTKTGQNGSILGRTFQGKVRFNF
jgi:hypothetical protein